MGSILSSPVKNQNTNHPPKEEEVEEGKEDVKDSLHHTPTMVTNNDFIIRDGFPVLYHCVPTTTTTTTTVSTSTSMDNNDNNKIKEEEPPQPNIDDIEEIPKQSFWSTLDDTPLLQVLTTKDEDGIVSSSSSSSLWWEQIQHDCHVVFDARTRCGGGDEEQDTTNSTKKNQNDTENIVVTTNDMEYSEGTTYFLPYEMKPRCTLEQIVQSILHTHTQHLQPSTFRPEQSGAEWWTLVLNQENIDSSKNDNIDDIKNDDDDDDDDEVGLHFDADYGLEHQIRNMMIHPRLATVTYMSGSTNSSNSSSNSILPTPTIIYNIKSPNSLRNVADRDPKVAFTSSVQPVDTIWISYPQLGKHIAFDGRLLHGATTSVFSTLLLKNHSSHSTQNNNKNDKNNNDAEERPTKKHKTENEASTTSTTAAKIETNTTNSTSKSPVQRITLMVNIWLNHCPLDAEPLEDDIIEQLITPFDSSKNDDSKKLIYWNDTAVSASASASASASSSSSSPVVDATITSIDITSSSNNIAATTEEIILCNHNVTVTYDTALVDAFHKYANHSHKNASTSSNLQIYIKDTNMIQIHVHDEIPESDDDDDENENEDDDKGRK